jgi:hypothetical protein
MSNDGFHRPGPPGLEPPASLTSVRVKRRASLLAPSGKRGDLTGGGGDAPAAIETTAAPEAPTVTQALMDAHHQAQMAQEAPAPPPTEPVFQAQPVHETSPTPPAFEPPQAAQEPSQPVVVLPPPVLGREDRETILPMTELLPEVAAEMHEQIQKQEHAAPAPEHSVQPHQPELVLSSPLPVEPAPAAEPEVTFEPESAAQARLMAEPAIIHEPEIIAEPALAAALGERTEPTLIIPSGPSSDRVVQLPTAAAEPAAQAEPTAAPEQAVEEVRAPDILDYWDGLRGTRDYPDVDEIDRAHVAGSWPNTVLLSFKTEIPQITRIGENNGEIEYTAMVTSWLMTRGRQAAKRGEPMEEEQKFPLSNGSARYRLLVLPMIGADSETCDHALCQITRAQERSAVASFKRWLAG